MNTYLKYQTPGLQFMAFLGLTAGFFILSWVISALLFADISVVLQDSTATITPEMVNKFKWAQFVSAIFSFVMPALLFGYYSSPKPFGYVGLYNNFSVTILILCVVLLVGIQPLVSWLGNLNAKAHFGSMQEALKQAEVRYTRALETFLKMRSPIDLMINLVVMALLPAVGEELFFRGALQKALLRWNKIPWLSIFISSVLFALLHGTFFKILPIFTLGLMLGTVFYVTRNLWYCIAIHFLNNALAVLAVYFGDTNETLKKFANDDISTPIYLVVLSIILTVTMIYQMKKKSDEVLPAFSTDEDNDYLA